MQKKKKKCNYINWNVKKLKQKYSECKKNSILLYYFQNNFDSLMTSPEEDLPDCVDLRAQI